MVRSPLIGVEGDAARRSGGWRSGDVAEGQAGYDGDLEREQAFPEHVFQGLPVFLEFLALGSCKLALMPMAMPGDLLEEAAFEHLGQHPVKAVGHFVQVFKEEDLVLKRGVIGSSERGAEPAVIFPPISGPETIACGAEW